LVSTIQILIVLLAVVAAVAVLAARLKIPNAILLVLTGVGLALVPGLPGVELAPELVLLLVVPPVVYTSAVAMSWREFRFNLRPISLLAIGCVLFTTIATAAATHLLLGLSWPVGFILGAIVSPPDAVAPLAIARRMQIPRRILVVLEGEGLANDATALILYRFAVAAVSVGAFSMPHAVEMFAAILVGEIVWGIGVGWAMLRLRRWVADPRIEITLSVLTPFLAYWPPEHLGGSGVLATVTAGLYISWNGLHLISAATRLQGVFFWDFLIYLIEGLVFLITGLQARTLITRIGHYSLSQLALSAVVVSLVVILARFVWSYPAEYLPRWLVPRIRKGGQGLPWQWVFALSFTGIRGIVSLAAALAIPLMTLDGQPFPERDLILFMTFSVILVTLVGQGLMLPWVISALGLANTGHQEPDAARAEEFRARQHAIRAGMEMLDRLGKGRFAADMIATMRAQQEDRLRHTTARREGRAAREAHDEVELLVIAAERQALNDLFRRNNLQDEARRHIERELDLREAHVLARREDASP
jgi:CPA1 family monovalent cation:H+ antiporter